MPKKKNPAIANLIKDHRGTFCTFWTGALHPSKPNIFITWGDKIVDSTIKNKSILSENWLRTLPTVEYAKACRDIDSIQGHGGVWHCGAHVHALDKKSQRVTPSLWHENAFLSGKRVAEKIKNHGNK
jgi:hypothetical protein